MSARDRLCIVTYDTHVKTVLPLLSMDKEGKRTAAQAAQAIKAGSQTNLSGGLLQGVAELSSRRDGADRPCSVLLLTDGEANQGIVEPPAIVQALEGCIEG